MTNTLTTKAPTAERTTWSVRDLTNSHVLGTVESVSELGARRAGAKAYNLPYAYVGAYAVESLPLTKVQATKAAQAATPTQAPPVVDPAEAAQAAFVAEGEALYLAEAHPPVDLAQVAREVTGAQVQAEREAAQAERAAQVANTHTPTAAILTALDSALSTIRLTHPDVPAALAVVISTGLGKKHGHFAAGTWVDTQGEHVGSARHELLIASETLGLGAEQVLTTLIHEAGHAMAHAQGIKDTTRQGRYHNEKFGTLASAMGLLVEKDAKHGATTPGLNTWAKAHYADTLTALDAVLSTHRVPVDPKAKAKKTTVRISCDCESALTVPIKWWDDFGSEYMVCALEESGDCSGWREVAV